MLGDFCFSEEDVDDDEEYAAKEAKLKTTLAAAKTACDGCLNNGGPSFGGRLTCRGFRPNLVVAPGYCQTMRATAEYVGNPTDGYPVPKYAEVAA